MANKKKLRTCSLCKNTYEYCPHCGEGRNKETWHLMWDTENCMEIDRVLSNWGAKIIDSYTAATLLKARDTSRMEFWNDSYKNAYNTIMSDAQETTEIPVVEPEITATEEPTPTVDEVIPPLEEDIQEEEHLSVSEELKKHNNNRHANKFNKKN